MVIKASAARQIQGLLRDLSSHESTTREAAIARLAIAGSRAVAGLIRIVEAEESSTAARIGAIRALERIADPHSAETVLTSASSGDAAVAAAAATALKSFMDSARGSEVLDRLTAIATDTNRDERVRLAAVQSLQDLRRPTAAPLWKMLQQDPNDAIRAVAAAHAQGRTAVISADPAADLVAAASGPLPDDPAGLRSALVRADDSVPISALHGLVDRIRAHEGSLPEGTRPAWVEARGAAHAALARRGSIMALYDLRESLERSAAPLPQGFVAALSAVGDATCLEPVASAYDRARQAQSADAPAWRRELARVFQTIARREKITPRHAVMKRIEKRWPGLLQSISRAQ